MKITTLSITVLVLALFNVYLSSINTSKTYEVSVFIEGENANLTRAADLLLDYDKSNLELVSATSGGFLADSSVITKDEWDDSRSLLMSTTVDTTKPILRLKFTNKKIIEPPNVRLSPNSTLYLSKIGSTTLPSSGIGYRIKYD